MTLNCSGGAPNPYQWKKDGSNLEGKTSPYLNLMNVTASNGGVYTCVVTSHLVNISIFIAPYFIMDHPQAICLEIDGTAVLTCMAEAFPPPIYHWIYPGMVLRGFEITIVASFSNFGNYMCNVTSGDIVISQTTTVHGK